MNNLTQPCQPVPNRHIGFTKQERAALELGVCASGCEDIDTMIKESERRRITLEVFKQLIHTADELATQEDVINESVALADKLIEAMNV